MHSANKTLVDRTCWLIQPFTGSPPRPSLVTFSTLLRGIDTGIEAGGFSLASKLVHLPHDTLVLDLAESKGSIVLSASLPDNLTGPWCR